MHLVYVIISSLPHSLFGPLLLTQLIELCKGIIQSPLNGTERPGMPSVSFGSSPSKQQVKAEVPFKMSHSDTTDTEAKVYSMFQWS